MRTFLITGGAGFIGSNFIRFLLNKYPDIRVINLDKLTYSGNLNNLRDIENDSRYTFVKGDIADRQTVETVFRQKPDILINFAAETHVDRSILGPDQFIKTNIYGTYNLLETSRRYKHERYIQISCYDEETKAFTRNGLKGYKEIKEDDLVLTLNIETNKVEWKPVEKVIVQDYTGKMIRMKTDTVDLLVTPNHRMLFQMKNTKRLVYKIAEDVAGESINKLPKHYQWEGEISDIIKKQKSPKDFMYILGVFIGDGFTAYQEKEFINKTGLSRKEYLQNARDGHGRFKVIGKVGTQKFTLSRSWRIFFDIPENDLCRSRCEKSLERLGTRWHKHKGKAGEHLYFNSKRFLEIFKQCGMGAKNKRIPDWALNAPPELLHPLLDGLLDSDGSRGYIFFTSSLELAHQVMVLCVKLGFNPILKSRFTKSRIGEREISGLSYMVLIGRTEWKGVRKEVISEENYAGKVWCLKIKDNKNFLIERNGMVAFCGNTDEVYGSIEKGSFKEDDNLYPNSPYAATKASADLLVLSYRTTYSMPVIIARSSNNFGPYQYPEKIISLFITNALEGKPLPIYGDGLQIRDWLYVLDNCRAIDFLIQKGSPGEVYNIGGGNLLTNMELTKLILKNLNKPETLIKHVTDRPGHDRRYSLNSKKIARLGWSPKTRFRDALSNTIEWYKTNPQWWQKIKSGEFKEYYKKHYSLT